jgi:hypothetical protein
MLLQLAATESMCRCDINFDRLALLPGRFFQIRDDYMNFCSDEYSVQEDFCGTWTKKSFRIYPCISSKTVRVQTKSQFLTFSASVSKASRFQSRRSSTF